MKIPIRLVLVTISLTLFFTLAAPAAKAQLVIPEILKRIAIHQKSLSSLRSKVTMVKYDSQLKEGDSFKGTLIYSSSEAKQLLLKIDWTKPRLESLSFINGQYIVYIPRLRQVIVGKIDKTKDAQFINALSFLHMTRKQIKGNYNISYRGQEKVTDDTDTWHLLITPKMPAIYKSAELWIDRNGMPIQAKVLQANDDSTTVLLSDFKKNETINFADFQPNLSSVKGIKVIQTSGSACLCYKPDNAKDALNFWSDVVFSGKVTAVNGANYTFRAEKIWKGKIGNEVAVRSFSMENSCTNKLKVGQRYVVFAGKSQIKDKNVLELMPCNYTSDIDSAVGRKTITEIGTGKPIKKQSVRKKRLPVEK